MDENKNNMIRKYTLYEKYDKNGKEYDKEFYNSASDFIKQTNELYYIIMRENSYIPPREDIASTLEYFCNIRDLDKCEYLSFMLNRYYPGEIQKLFNVQLNTEHYEVCETLKNFINNNICKDFPDL